MQKTVLEEIEEEAEPIMLFREQVLKEWKFHDPLLNDIEGFRKHFNEAYTKRMKVEEKKIEEFADNLATELLRPKIVWPSPWNADMPKPLSDRIQIDRLAQFMSGVTGLATLSEVVYYLYPRTMEAPLDSTWTDIYLYCGKETMLSIKKAMGDEIHDLGNYEESLLLTLRRRIWESSVKGLKKQRKE